MHTAITRSRNFIPITTYNHDYVDSRLLCHEFYSTYSRERQILVQQIILSPHSYRSDGGRI